MLLYISVVYYEWRKWIVSVKKAVTWGDPSSSEEPACTLMVPETKRRLAYSTTATYCISILKYTIQLGFKTTSPAVYHVSAKQLLYIPLLLLLLGKLTWKPELVQIAVAVFV